MTKPTAGMIQLEYARSSELPKIQYATIHSRGNSENDEQEAHRDELARGRRPWAGAGCAAAAV